MKFVKSQVWEDQDDFLDTVSTDASMGVSYWADLNRENGIWTIQEDLPESDGDTFEFSDLGVMDALTSWAKKVNGDGGVRSILVNNDYALRAAQDILDDDVDGLDMDSELWDSMVQDMVYGEQVWG